VPQFGAQPQTTSFWPWVLGGVAILVALTLVIGGVVFFVNNRGGTITASRTTPSAAPETPLPEPTPSQSAAAPLRELPQPSGGRITDPVTGLSYAFPGDPWSVPKSSEINNPANVEVPQWTSGYMAISQKNYDGKDGDWVGSVYAAVLPQAVPYSGTQDLGNTVASVLLGYEGLFYGPQHERKILRNEAMKVSGHDAWVTEFEMDFTQQAKAKGWKWKTERGAFVLVDRGSGQRPSLLYISVPDNLDQSVIGHVLDSLEAS
jgi:hypothetical protein